MGSHLAVLADEGSNRGHRTLAEKAFETMHRAIITGRLRPGARLPIERMTDDNSAAASAAHHAFHFALYDAAGSAWLERLIRPVWETSERYCLEVPQVRQLAKRRREHRAILEACIAHDPDAAALALHDHLARTANNISEAMGGKAPFELGVDGRSNDGALQA